MVLAEKADKLEKTNQEVNKQYSIMSAVQTYIIVLVCCFSRLFLHCFEDSMKNLEKKEANNKTMSAVLI